MQQEYAHAVCQFLEQSFEDMLSLRKREFVIDKPLACSVILPVL